MKNAGRRLVAVVFWHFSVPSFMHRWITLQPLRTASQSHVEGQSNLYGLTGNYRFETRGEQFGTYFIGGQGSTTESRTFRQGLP